MIVDQPELQLVKIQIRREGVANGLECVQHFLIGPGGSVHHETDYRSTLVSMEQNVLLFAVVEIAYLFQLFAKGFGILLGRVSGVIDGFFCGSGIFVSDDQLMSKPSQPAYYQDHDRKDTCEDSEPLRAWLFGGRNRWGLTHSAGADGFFRSSTLEPWLNCTESLRKPKKMFRVAVRDLLLVRRTDLKLVQESARWRH